MNAKPTPGPWEVAKYGAGQRVVVPGKKGFMGEYRIADAHFSDALANTARAGEAAANARLIAAAPDMLAALTLVEPILGHGPVTQETIEAYKAVADAIARANGMPAKE